jgi:tocopherol O-methyltransferase
MIVPKQPQTTAAVALHYDELDGFYREIWGEHVHHGYWATGRESPEEAVDALVDLLADRLRLAPGMKLCDVGCGYGATAERLVRTRQVDVTGVTVSAAQAAHASRRLDGLRGVTIALQDWLDNRFADGAFDRVYAIESSEHMPDKQRFFDEAWRVLKPGGMLGTYAWLACPQPKAWEVRHLLEPICREGRLPSMGDEADYLALAARSGFATVQVQDLSDRVRRTWSICAKRVAAKLVTDPRYAGFLLASGAANRIFALTLLRLLIAYRTRSMRYELLVFAKSGA